MRKLHIDHHCQPVWSDSVDKPYQKLCRLTWAKNELQRIADYITPAIAPQSAKKIRSAIKSVDGAIRHAQSMAGREVRRA